MLKTTDMKKKKEKKDFQRIVLSFCQYILLWGQNHATMNVLYTSLQFSNNSVANSKKITKMKRCIFMHASKGILNLPTSSLHLCTPFQQNL